MDFDTNEQTISSGERTENFNKLKRIVGDAFGRLTFVGTRNILNERECESHYFRWSCLIQSLTIFILIWIFTETISRMRCHRLNHATVRLEFKWELNMLNLNLWKIWLLSCQQTNACVVLRKTGWWWKMSDVCLCESVSEDEILLPYIECCTYRTKEKVYNKKWLQVKVRKLLAKCEFIFVTCTTHFIRSSGTNCKVATIHSSGIFIASNAAKNPSKLSSNVKCWK